MRLLVVILIGLLIWLSYQLWIPEDRGVKQVRMLEQALKDQKKENAALEERNNALEAEVKNLKEGLAAIEERARVELGLIRKDETFFRILEESAKAKSDKQP